MLRLLLWFALAGALASGSEVTGTWNFAVETDAGSGNPVFTLKQEGEKLSGTYKGMLGEAAVTGSVKGREVTIEFDHERVNGKIRYTGTLDADSKSMKGKVAFGDAGSGTFTAAKK